jgi:hypothetical protein
MIIVVGIFCTLMGFLVGISIRTVRCEGLDLPPWEPPPVTISQYENAVALADELIGHVPEIIVNKWRYDEDLRIHQRAVQRLKEDRDLG